MVIVKFNDRTAQNSGFFLCSLHDMINPCLPKYLVTINLNLALCTAG